ncbi:hypothetical protein PN836_002390 [Ningiella sp. W23]|uniref:hypothetical protein n=1 Tax=Ningiella sp. W23 TaxID=3023715 RepID=UPI0037566F09
MKELNVKEIESTSGGGSFEFAVGGIGGFGTGAGLGVKIGAVGGPAGMLVGGLVGGLLGTIGGTYAAFKLR